MPAWLSPAELGGRPLVAFGFEQVTVAGVAIGFTATKAAGAKAVVVTVETAPIRYREDGATTAPTATIGQLLNPGDVIQVYGPDVQTIQFIRQGGVSATIDCTYYM